MELSDEMLFTNNLQSQKPRTYEEDLQQKALKRYNKKYDVLSECDFSRKSV